MIFGTCFSLSPSLSLHFFGNCCLLSKSLTSYQTPSKAKQIKTHGKTPPKTKQKKVSLQTNPNGKPITSSSTPCCFLLLSNISVPYVLGLKHNLLTSLLLHRYLFSLNLLNATSIRTLSMYTFLFCIV